MNEALERPICREIFDAQTTIDSIPSNETLPNARKYDYIQMVA
jgi:hypothetical protein